jgi:hypothetical protein
MRGRSGGFSIIRVGTIVAIVGAVLIVGAVVSFYLDRSSHQVPLEIDLYPGAAKAGEIPRSNAGRSVYFQIQGATAEQVVEYYQHKMDQFYGNSEEKCQRMPLTGNFPEYDKGQPNVPPYQFSCMFDRSGFQTTQTTRVNIQPGIGDAKGKTMVEYDQHWQP